MTNMKKTYRPPAFTAVCIQSQRLLMASDGYTVNNLIDGGEEDLGGDASPVRESKSMGWDEW